MVEIRVFSTKRYDRDGFERANEAHGHAVTFLEPRRHAVATTTLDNITAVVNGDDCPNVVPNT